MITIFVLLVIAGALGQEATLKAAAENDARAINPFEIGDIYFRECGGLIYSMRSPFHIDYKSGTTLGGSEFCVWAFQSLDEKEIITVQYAVTPSGDSRDGTFVYTWGTDGFRGYEMPKNTTSITVNGRAVFVAISTFPEGSKGAGYRIVLHGRLANSKSKIFVANQPEGKFSYPAIAEKEHYDNHDEVAVVIQTQKNRSPADKYKFKEVLLANVDTEYAVDVIRIVELYPYFYGRPYSDTPNTSFKEIASVSGSRPGLLYETVSYTPFPYLVLFSSDKKITGSGFTIRWKDHEQL